MKRASTNNIPLYTASNRTVNQPRTPHNVSAIRAAHIVFFALSLCLGCSSDDTVPNTNGSESGGSGGSAGTFSTAGTAGVAGSAGSFVAGAAGTAGENQGGIGGSGAIAGTGGSNGGASGDGNDSFETASLEWGENSLDPPATDADFFRLELTEGDWIHLWMDAPLPNSVSEVGSPYVDTVMRLYDANGVQIAFNDDGIPRADPDSRILFRVPKTGSYYVEVESFCLYYSVPEQCQGTTIGEYTAKWADWTPAPWLADIEPNDNVEMAQAYDAHLAFEGSDAWVAINASFSTASDVDLFRVHPQAFTAEQPLTETVGVRMVFSPSGPNGSGSTATVGDVTAWTVAGDQQSPYSAVNIASKLQLPKADTHGASVMVFVNSQEDVWFEIRRESGTGDNDFYSAWPIVQEVLDIEAETTDSHSNDSIANATILANPLVNMLGTTYYALHGYLDANDTDVFHFYTTPSSTEARIYCEAEVSGSGIRNLTVDLQTSDGTSILSAPITETSVRGASVTAPLSAASSEYFLVLSSSSPSASTIPWYYCQIFVE